MSLIWETQRGIVILVEDKGLVVSEQIGQVVVICLPQFMAKLRNKHCDRGLLLQ